LLAAYLSSFYLKREFNTVPVSVHVFAFGHASEGRACGGGVVDCALLVLPVVFGPGRRWLLFIIIYNKKHDKEKGGEEARTNKHRTRHPSENGPSYRFRAYSTF